MPGPGVLIPGAAMFGCAAALGVGIFIGLNWERIRDTAQDFIDEKRVLWENGLFEDSNSYRNSDESSEEEKGSVNSAHTSEESAKPSDYDGSLEYSGLRSAFSSSSQGQLRRRSQTITINKTASGSGSEDELSVRPVRDLTVYGVTTHTESGSDTESELSSVDEGGTAFLTSDELSSFEEIDVQVSEGFSSPEII